MSKTFDSLNKEFDLENSSVDVEVVNDEPNFIKKAKQEKSDFDRDYEYTRGNLYSIIEKGQEALNGVLEVAAEGGSPRAYEVAGQLIKNLSDATEKLVDLQKKVKDIKQEDKPKGPTNVTNALFVGSTADLQKLLKKNTSDK
jgi:hypothetical protein